MRTASGKRQDEEARSRVYKLGDGLQGMPTMYSGLLMQELDGWHLLAAFGSLDAILTVTSRPLTRTGIGNRRSTVWAHKAASRSSLIASL
jgi:hypothetical protein